MLSVPLGFTLHEFLEQIQNHFLIILVILYHDGKSTKSNAALCLQLQLNDKERFRERINYLTVATTFSIFVDGNEPADGS